MPRAMLASSGSAVACDLHGRRNRFNPFAALAGHDAGVWSNDLAASDDVPPPLAEQKTLIAFNADQRPAMTLQEDILSENQCCFRFATLASSSDPTLFSMASTSMSLLASTG